MSISRHFDSYMAKEGIVPIAEVVPESSCEVFEGVDGVQVVEVTPELRLDAARDAVQKYLG